jgi:hypothetical protein
MSCPLPTAVIRTLREPVLTAADFTPMKFTPADTKAWFANHFLRFVSSDFSKHHFTLRFYRQVMHTFGHIAHYDAAGYWAEFFTNNTGKIEFIEQAVHHPCYGDPTHTFSDVEREIARRLRQAKLLDLYRGRDRADRDAAERAEFARLKARFEPGELLVPASAPIPPPVPPAGRNGRKPAPVAQLAFAIG